MHQKENPGYKLKPYRGYLCFILARLHIDSMFHYTNLYMITRYVNGKLEGYDYDSKILKQVYLIINSSDMSRA